MMTHTNNLHIKGYVVINRCTYLEEPIQRGKIACAERDPERVGPEIKFTTVRLTNLYNPGRGQKSPLTVVQGVMLYVVAETLNCSKQPSVRNMKNGEGPKVNKRQRRLELGISRNVKAWGKRRIHITVSYRKGFSFNSPDKRGLAGSVEEGQITILKRDIKEGRKVSNLSLIMSDPNFLVASWVRIRSNRGSLTKALTNVTLDGIDARWFVRTSRQMRNGIFQFSPSRRTYIPKPNGKLRPLTMPSPRDKIVQEGMRFLLELVFERTFRECSHGWRPGRGATTVIKSMRLKCSSVAWFVEGDIEQQFPSMDHTIMVELLKERINDQAFIDLIYKYLRTGYAEKEKSVEPMKKGVIQGGTLSPVLANIYMTPFDEWMEDVVIPSFNKGKRRRQNPEYTKLTRAGSDHDLARRFRIPSVLGNDEKFKRLSYYRYADDFILGVIGSKKDCETLKVKIKEWLCAKLKLDLNVDKTKVTHAVTDSAKFLGHRVHNTSLKRRPVRRNVDGVLTRINPRLNFDAPIRDIVEKLKEKGFAKNEGRPTRNGKFIHHSLADIVNHFKMVENGIVNFYELANNYSRMSSRVHYIMKYSCALTICSKKRLRTLKKTFSVYGANLEIKDGNNEVVANYPKRSYVKPSYPDNIWWNLRRGKPDKLIDKLCARIGRGRKDLKGPCVLCESTENIEIHHINHLSKKKVKKFDYLAELMRRMNRKQVPLCAECHRKVHRGLKDQGSLKT
ncbi:MAG: group II intron reverse transcriptase/maturase [Cyanobacteria bacterium P01_H01_bin.150]